MQPNLINGWREVLARVFEGFDAELNVSPEWLINPDTNRKLKLDYLYRDINVAIRFVGLEGREQKRRKSDQEVEQEQEREDAREAVCREHRVILVNVDVDDEPLNTLRRLESALSRATAQLAQNTEVPQARKQALMPLLSQARRRAGEFTAKLTVPEKLNVYAEMWYERQANLSAQTPAAKKASGPPPAFRQGMDVYHQRFGPGQITGIAPEAKDMNITVSFMDGSVRTFLASLVTDKLTPQ
jgi:hypothetical protein